MLALVMAGGRGSRMRPVSDVNPKPLLPVRNRPVLEWTLLWLEAAGVAETIVATGYLSDLIKVYLAGREPSPMCVECFVEEEPLGTAGVIGKLTTLTDPFLVVNGDVLTTFRVSGLLATHRRTGALITLGTRTMVHETRSGVLRKGPSGVVAYDEKPSIPYEIAAGVYLLSSRARGLVPPGPFDMPQLVNAAIAKGYSVQTHELDGYWMDVGVPDQYEAGTRDFPGLGRHAGA